MAEFLLTKNNKGFSIFTDSIQEAQDIADLLDANLDGELVERTNLEHMILADYPCSLN